MLADIEEKLKEKGRGGTILGSNKIYSLANLDVSRNKIMCFKNQRCTVEYKWKINEKIVKLKVRKRMECMCKIMG